MKYTFILTALMLTGSMSSGKASLVPSSVIAPLDNNKSFIHTHTMQNAKGDSARHNIQYFDGLGKPIQTVDLYTSPTGGDLVTTTTYDSMGRISQQWLPLHVSGNNGAFLPLPFGNTVKQYADSLPFQRFEYDHLPESRRIAQSGAGQKWSGKVVRGEYLVNDDANHFNCLHYEVDDYGNLSEEGSYEPEKFLVKKETDEDGKVVYAFSDVNNKTILTRAVNGSTLHDTYYVYDRARENLCYVLTPMYQDKPDLNLYAYQYRYDEHDRCVLKKLPGVAAIRYVYDKADRLICYQDGNQSPRKEWTFTVQDKIGRDVLKGLANTSTDNSPSIQGNLVFATRTQGAGDMGCGYAINGLTSMSGFQPKETNYYDDYSFLTLESASKQQQLAYGFLDYPSWANTIKNEFSTGYMTVSGLQSGQRTYTESNAYLSTSYYYDQKGRVIQQRSTNHLGGYDVDFNSYTFTGLLKSRIHVHTVPGKDTMTECYSYVYDNGDRLKQVLFRLNNEPEMILSENEYDELCRLKTTKLNNGKTAQNYDYNIRGWVTSIDSPCFKQKLHYTDGPGTPCYNGNVNSMTWKTSNDTAERGYKFAYDGINRITDAIYGEGGNLASNQNRFNEQVTSYDKQGNIQVLKRYGQTSATGYGLIDDLSMTYEGNQLKNVTDKVVGSAYNNGFEFKDGPKQEVTEYFYDSNGNLTKDLNKKIAGITYNCLNLAQKITFEDGSTITYAYDAGGTKLRTVHSIAGKTTSTDYCANAIYENGVLKTLLVESGYISFPDKKFHFYLKDHQGNIRVVIDSDGQVEETNSYYPFGGIFANTSSVQPYKYNGKELDTKNRLDWYDYGARQYDAAIGRWHVVDPMSEDYYSKSSYAYCANNPINIIDPDGKDIIVLHDRKGAGGFGHTAMLIGNETDGWRYLSKDGGKGIILSGGPDVGKDKFDNIQQFDNSKYAGQYHGYQNRARFTTTKEQDAAAYATMWKEAHSWYDVTANNCMDAVAGALRAAGFHAEKSYYVGADNPFADPILVGEPRPNPRYDRLLEMNKKFIIEKTENANRQFNKINNWNDFFNSLQGWLTINPNIIIQFSMP